MNLAEIRKKANRDREHAAGRPDGAIPVSTETPLLEDEYALEHDSVLIDLDSEPEPELSPESAPSGFSGSGETLPAEADDEPEPFELPVSSQIIATPAFPASSAIEFASSIPLHAPTEMPDMPGSIPATHLEPGQTVDQQFDPLAILMAGRSSSGYGDDSELSADDASETEVADYHEFLCFRVSTEQYAINIMEIKEIIKPREITEVPRAPGFISGVLSLRGIIIPVFNMVKRLHLEPSGTANRERIIVVSKGEELFGILVDEVLQVVRIPEGSIELPPAVLEGIDRDFVQGIGRHSSGMLILLNLGSILDVSLC